MDSGIRTAFIFSVPAALKCLTLSQEGRRKGRQPLSGSASTQTVKVCNPPTSPPDVAFLLLIPCLPPQSQVERTCFSLEEELG